MGERPLYFFLHLQKTGGTALFQRLRDSFGPDAVYPTPTDQGDVAAVIDVDHLVDEVRAHRDQLQVITGHFPLCTLELLDGPFRTFTVLRHPVERTLSLLRRRQAAEARFRGLELDQIYEDEDLRAIIGNHMVKMLSLTVAEMGSTPLTLPLILDADRLETAQQALARIDVMGVQERFEEFCDALESAFGWDLGAPRFANRTEARPVSEGLRERIGADNALDMELHRFAIDLLAERGPTAGARG